MADEQATQSGATPAHFPIVAIGGSAGALEALQAFFAAVPTPCGIAFVVVTHQHPGRTSLLPELLARHASIPVSPVEDDTPVEPDHVYVAIPDWQLSIEDGTLRRAGPHEPTGGDASAHAERPDRHPVDAFFRALAADQGDRAIAVILSGTGTDGTIGLKSVKAQAGMVVAQQPDSARFDGMPGNAIASGLVDHVLLPEEMPAVIMAYADMRSRRLAAPVACSGTIDEHVFGEIFALLRMRTNHDFSGYKRSTLRRRIERRMNVHRLETAREYLHFLQNRPHEIDLLFREIVISVTAFFRDPEVWEILREGPLMQLVREHPADRELRAWVAGCATGEEAYSLAIMLLECMQACGRQVPIQIFASDVDNEAIEFARVGRYASGIANDVPADLLERYFIQEQDHYRVSKEVREEVVFALHNVVQDPPFTRLEFLSCRNLLIYMESELQRRLLPIFHYALAPGGVLFLGSSESIGEFEGAFDVVDARSKVFRRRPGPAMYGVASLQERMPTAGYPKASRTTAGTAVDATRDLARLVERLLVTHYVPPSVVVNDRGGVIYVHGRTGRYLEPASGLISNDLLSMAREGLRSPLADVLRRLAVDEAREVGTRARVSADGSLEHVMIEARRIEHPESLRGLRLVSFRALPQAEPEKRPAEERTRLPATSGTNASAQVTHLEQELDSMRADKQAAVEELEASNEELQSTNEELQSTNEELQSSNEELETSKEEMESLNEELTTVNAELEAKLHDLAQANDDMQNLLNATSIATVFLDGDLHVKRFTQAARNLVALRQSDIGRPLQELASTLTYASMDDDAQRVLETLQPEEREVQSRDGRHYLMRLVPYRTTDNVIDGLVVTFLDIERAKHAEHHEHYYGQIIESLPEALLVTDSELRVVSANKRSSGLFRLETDRVVGRPLLELGGGEWKPADLGARLTAVLEGGETIEGLEIDGDFGRVGRKRLRLDARTVVNGEGEAPMLLVLIKEVPAQE